MSDLRIIRRSTTVWVENIRQVLPVGSSRLREAVGGLGRILDHPKVVDGTTIALTSVN